MSYSYWQKQSEDTPLFPHILWSRPESKAGAGRLAIIGGNSFAIGAPGLAYNQADQSGAGVIHVVMPQSVKKNVSVLLPDAEFESVPGSRYLWLFCMWELFCPGLFLQGSFFELAAVPILV